MGNFAFSASRRNRLFTQVIFGFCLSPSRDRSQRFSVSEALEKHYARAIGKVSWLTAD